MKNPTIEIFIVYTSIFDEKSTQICFKYIYTYLYQLKLIIEFKTDVNFFNVLDKGIFVVRLVHFIKFII